MYCPQCGTEVQPQHRFCGSCGAAQPETAAPARKVRTPESMQVHVKILAWLLVGSGVLMGMLSTMVLLAGRILEFVDFGFTGVEMDLGVFLTSIISLVAISMVVVSGLTAAAGVGLLYYQTWGRVMAIIAAVFMLFKFPVGTAIGIYAFWVLLSAEGREHYRIRSALTAA